VFVGNRHLDDSALIRRYLAERGLEALETSDEAGLRHLVRCEACEARYVALQRTFDDARDAVINHADATFTPDRLAEQREHILRRVDAQYSGPRVLTFPTGATTAHAAVPSSLVKGWIAVAAAAGLVIGLSAGQLIHIRRDTASSVRNAVPALGPAIGPAHATPVLRSANGVQTVDEDEFLSEVDMAAAAPQAAELRAIYAFTMEAPRDSVPARTRKN
jgi:hypothetical protein